MAWYKHNKNRYKKTGQRDVLGRDLYKERKKFINFWDKRSSNYCMEERRYFIERLLEDEGETSSRRIIYKRDYSYDLGAVVQTVIRSLTSFAGTLALSEATVASDKADLNYGVLAILTLGVSTMVTALSQATFQGEVNSLIDYAGIFFVAIGAAIVAIGAAQHEAEVLEHPDADPKAAENAKDKENHHTEYGINIYKVLPGIIQKMIDMPGEQMNAEKMALTFALASAITFSSINGLIKTVVVGQTKFCGKYYPKVPSIDGIALFGVLSFPLFVYYIAYVQPAGYCWTTFGFMNLALVLEVIAADFASKAIMLGKTVRVQSLMQANTFALIVVFAIMYGKVPTAVEVLGIILGLVGLLILSLSEFDEMALEKEEYKEAKLIDKLRKQRKEMMKKAKAKEEKQALKDEQE